MRDKVHKLIVDAVEVNGTLEEPFTAHDIRRLFPGWGYTRYYTHLATNCSNNQPETVALYRRVGRGKYALHKKTKC